MSDSPKPVLPAVVEVQLHEGAITGGYAQLYIEDDGRFVLRGSREMLEKLIIAYHEVGVELKFDDEFRWCG